MFSYASKRITRGRGLTVALFLSVVLAATLFSGILQGADAVSGSALDNMLKNTKFDIMTTNIYEKNTTKVNIFNIDSYFKTLDGVDGVDHFVRHSIELNSTTINGTIPVTLISLPPSGEIAEGVTAPNGFEDGKIYIDLGSMNATKFTTGQTIDVGMLTYTPTSCVGRFQAAILPSGGGLTDNYGRPDLVYVRLEHRRGLLLQPVGHTRLRGIQQLGRQTPVQHRDSHREHLQGDY